MTETVKAIKEMEKSLGKKIDSSNTAIHTRITEVGERVAGIEGELKRINGGD